MSLIVSIKGHRPQRTCLGCGGRDDQSQLLRLAVTEQGRLVVDRNLGRGGYLHRNEECWRMFLGRKSPYRAFHTEITKAAKEQLVNELKSRDWE